MFLSWNFCFSLGIWAYKHHALLDHMLQRGRWETQLLFSPSHSQVVTFFRGPEKSQNVLSIAALSSIDVGHPAAVKATVFWRHRSVTSNCYSNAWQHRWLACARAGSLCLDVGTAVAAELLLQLTSALHVPLIHYYACFLLCSDAM